MHTATQEPDYSSANETITPSSSVSSVSSYGVNKNEWNDDKLAVNPQMWDEGLIDNAESSQHEFRECQVTALRQKGTVDDSYLCLTSSDALRISEEDGIRLASQAILSGEMSRRTFDRLQSTPGTDMPPETFDSRYKVEMGLNRQTGHIAALIDCCINACQTFYGPTSQDLTCSVCHAARYEDVCL